MKARVYANGEDMGVYEGGSDDAILDAYAQDAGYQDFADLLEQVPDATRDEVTLEPAE